ncbi:MAG: Gfo/Idh/MocA family oxidoreductase [Oscillospiraceae bacterium]
MIKIGIVNIDTSHPLEFVKSMVGDDRCKFIGVYNDGFRGNDEVDAFCKKFDIKRYDDLSSLVKDVDIGFIQGCNFDKHVSFAEYFFKENKPVFLDKPMVGNLSDIEKLEQYAKSGKIILGSSSVRYCDEILEYKGEKQGKVQNVFATVGVDDFNYAIHIAEGVCALIADTPISVTCTYASKLESMYLVKFSGGQSATMLLVKERFLNFNFTVITSKVDNVFQINNSKLYKSLLTKICDYLEGDKEAIPNLSELLIPIRIMLACKIAKESGNEVFLSELSKFNPKFDGYEFEKEYREKAVKIYLNIR